MREKKYRSIADALADAERVNARAARIMVYLNAHPPLSMEVVERTRARFADARRAFDEYTEKRKAVGAELRAEFKALGIDARDYHSAIGAAVKRACGE